jgi:hypothetical protein
VDIKTLSARKVAGIPVIYLGLLFVAVALYSAIKMKSGSSAPAAADPTATGDITGDTGVDTSQPVFQATPTITQPSGVVTSVTATSGPDTDELWKRRSIDWLRQNGYTLDVATSAITKYLAGDPLSTVEAQARDKAVQQFGLPPESVPGTSTVANPAPDPVSTPVDVPTTPNWNGPASRQGTPPCNHTVKGTSDNSFGELARLYYGQWGGGNAILIRSHNIGVPEPIPIGTVVHIPRHVNPEYYRATSATRTAVAIARKNGLTVSRLHVLNPGDHFPVRAGTRVRVR